MYMKLSRILQFDAFLDFIVALLTRKVNVELRKQEGLEPYEFESNIHLP